MWPKREMSDLHKSMIHKGSKKFNRWLSSVNLLSGHIKIINKKCGCFIEGQAVDTLSSSIQFGHDDVLKLICTGLSREVNKEGLIDLKVNISHELLSNISRFSGASNTDVTEGLSTPQADIKEVFISSCIHCWYNDVSNLHSLEISFTTS